MTGAGAKPNVRSCARWRSSMTKSGRKRNGHFEGDLPERHFVLRLGSEKGKPAATVSRAGFLHWTLVSTPGPRSCWRRLRRTHKEA